MDDGWRDEDFSIAYQSWLSDTFDPDGRYRILFDLLHDVEYNWHIDRDEDRDGDGRYLRERFSNESSMQMPWGCLEWPCSFLEFVAALAYAIEDRIMYDPDTLEGPIDWFWMMMENADLKKCDDEWMRQGSSLAFMWVMERVNCILDRHYRYDGSGGFFPLENPRRDQRKTEVWMQLNEYCEERFFS